ncbi:MAG: hypothetical protein GWN64_17225 [Candidatus Thorarchaeota archaeon]|nr:hypothetical protein [Candidatus Thorarchaeota archaeon]
MKKIFSMFLVLALALCPVAFSASDTETTTKINSISEKTSGSGVTVDGVLLKDSEVAASALPELTVANSADQACDTTCGIADCWIGVEVTSGNFVACSDATADTCLCDGATS